MELKQEFFCGPQSWVAAVFQCRHSRAEKCGFHGAGLSFSHFPGCVTIILIKKDFPEYGRRIVEAMNPGGGLVIETESVLFFPTHD